MDKLVARVIDGVRVVGVEGTARWVSDGFREISSPPYTNVCPHTDPTDDSSSSRFWQFPSTRNWRKISSSFMFLDFGTIQSINCCSLDLYSNVCLLKLFDRFRISFGPLTSLHNTIMTFREKMRDDNIFTES